MRFEDRFEGALILDSHLEYSFTERNQRLARFAAEKAASLVARLRAVDAHQARIDLGLFAAQTIHAIMRPLANIQKLVDLLRGVALNEKTGEWVTLIEQEKNRAAQLFRENAEGIQVRDTPEILDQYLAREFSGIFHCSSSADTQLLTSFWLTSALKRLIENAEEAAEEEAGDRGAVSCRCSVCPNGMICFTIENPGRLLSDEEVEAMKRVGQSGKSGSSGTHLGLGVPLAEIGIAYARGELQLRPRSTGGLIAMVILPAILNPMNRTTGSTR